MTQSPLAALRDENISAAGVNWWRCAQGGLALIALIASGCSDASLTPDKISAAALANPTITGEVRTVVVQVGAPTPAEPELSQDAVAILQSYDGLVGLGDNRARFFCSCEHPQTTTPEFEQCLAEQTTIIPPPVQACMRDVLMSDPRSRDNLECDYNNNRQYIECLEQGACSEFERVTDCEIERITRDISCSNLPWDIWAETQERCWGREQPPAFECDSGQLVSSAWVCDREEDCDDGSDELACDPHAGL